MALQVPRERASFPWIRTILTLLIVGLLIAAGWYAYRWYFYGERPPVDIPALATADARIDESEVTRQQVAEHNVAPSEPRYLSIPSLGIEQARVFGVGIDKKTGALDVPKNLSDTAWYTASATPGSGGAILVDGHNGGITRDGVFAKLSTLKVGDSIELERGDGKRFRYEVRENKSVPLDEANASGMKRMMESIEPGKETLNIITCDGRWVPRLKQFDHRIMLRAALVE